mmetsp:Transcript_59014/g.97581  ORF Transcript_59014/g.97581 Transcript_59014/m.97581 type:complete len:267 (-) Transcript_59014:1724-2524(-)
MFKQRRLYNIGIKQSLLIKSPLAEVTHASAPSSPIHTKQHNQHKHNTQTDTHRYHPLHRPLYEDAASFVIVTGIAFVFRKQIFLNIGRHDLVCVEFHGIRRPTFGNTPELRDVLEHIGEGNLCTHHLHVTALSQLSNHATPAVDVANNVTHRLFRDGYVHLHDRLHELGACLAQALARGLTASNLESHHRRINVVESAIDERSLATDDRETGKHATTHNRLETLGHARDILLRDGPTLDVLLEDKSIGLPVLVEGSELDDHLSELT